MGLPLRNQCVEPLVAQVVDDSIAPVEHGRDELQPVAEVVGQGGLV